MEKVVRGLDEFKAEVTAFTNTLTPSVGIATLVTLSGELGSGKTTFTQTLAKTLGVSESVTSPTYVIEKKYTLPLNGGRGFTRLVHIDAYRLKSGNELSALRFEETMLSPDTLIVLEWPERVADTLPEPAHKISLEVLGEGRKITYEN